MKYDSADNTLKTHTIPRVLLFIIDASIMFLGVTLLALPYVFRMLPVRLISIHFFGDNYRNSLIFFSVCIILFLALINETRKLLKLMVYKTIFSELSCKYFKRISLLSFALCLVFIYKSVVDFSMPTPLMAATFLFLGIFALTLESVFYKARFELNEEE